ncbi:MAG: PDGLE domain-containing protein [Methanobrevibacter sp.]|jgi:cobalt/nickel transport protein|nr:PDGLE domain-containing protein [Methanobrevibacter sp.]
MENKDKNLLIVGVVIAFLIAISAAFFASTNPDGLESTAEKLNPGALDAPAVHEAIMPDYKIPIFGDSPISGAIAIVMGVIIVFALAYFVGSILKKKSDK